MEKITGTDDITVGSVYVVNLSGTTDVWTVENDDVYVRSYDSSNTKQHFQLTIDSNNRYGFYSAAAGRRVSRNQFENLKCERPYETQGSWECFVEIRREAEGKYKFYMTVGDAHRPLRKVSDAGGDYFTIQNKGDEVTFGLTKV